MASPLVVNPVAKCAHVSTLLRDQNYGDADELWACNYDFFGTKYTCLAYMEADISSISEGATISADSKLEIYIAHRYTDRTMVWWWAQDAWDEGTITYNDQPGGAAPVFNYSPPEADGWFTITGEDLATWLQAMLDDKGGNASWQMHPSCLATQEGGFRFASDDDTNDPSRKPKLTVVYTVGRRWGEVPSSELVPNDFGADERRFGAVPSDETVAEDFGADDRRFGSVSTDESVPTDLT